MNKTANDYMLEQTLRDAREVVRRLESLTRHARNARGAGACARVELINNSINNKLKLKQCERELSKRGV